jgi:hypothetical protein
VLLQEQKQHGACHHHCSMPVAGTPPDSPDAPALTRAPCPLPLPQIWFLGKADVQKIKGNPHLQKTNYGYDDERGDYMVRAGWALAGASLQLVTAAASRGASTAWGLCPRPQHLPTRDTCLPPSRTHAGPYCR